MNGKEEILERLSSLASDALDIREMADPESDAWGLIDDIRTFIEDVTEQIDDECEEIPLSEDYLEDCEEDYEKHNLE